MTSIEQHLAPGCYGSALTYRNGAEECRTCPFAVACAPLSAERMERLRTELGINVRVKKHKPEKPKPVVAIPDGGTMTVPNKVAATLERIERVGVKVTEALRKGTNPWVGHAKPPYQLKILCHMLLRCPLGVPKALFVEALVRKMDWTHEYASASARGAVQVMTALGAITENQAGLLQLTRAAKP